MGQITLGPKKLISNYKTSLGEDRTEELLNLQNKIDSLEQDLESALSYTPPPAIETFKYVPVETVKEVKVIEQVKIYVDKFIEVPTVVYEIKEVPVYKTKVVQNDIIREIEKVVEVEIEKIINIYKIPKWVFGVIGIEFLVIIALLIH